MILAKARLIEGGRGRVRIGLSFPTGFDPDEVVQDSVLANGDVRPVATRVDPRNGTLNDIYREFEVSFSEETLETAGDGSVSITGRFRRGLPFSARLVAAGRASLLDQ